MSMGFGFSLPAYPLRGGGGNNPFNQSGPTLDLSFTGNAGNLSGADTYTLDTNFITPQYQVAAQYAVWVAGSGLTQRNFADIVTFSRGSNATQFDSTGSLVYAPVNLLLRSEALATSPWFSSGLTSITNNTPNTVDPAGGNTATELVVAASAGIAGQGAVLSGVNHTGSVWLRCASGTVTGSLIIYLTASPFTNIGTQAITITTTWQRFSVTTSALPVAGIGYNFQIHNLSGGTVYAWGAQLNPTQILGGITSSLTTYYPTTTTAYYGPRFDYDPSTLAAQGLLIEEQRANNFIWSDSFRARQLDVTVTSGTFQNGETVTATGGGAGTYIAADSTATSFAIYNLTNTSAWTGTLTGGTSGATATINAFVNVWSNGVNVTITRNTQAAPDGTTTADTMAASTVGTFARTTNQELSTSTQGAWTFSLFVKAGTLTNNLMALRLRDNTGTHAFRANFNLSTLAVPTVSIDGATWVAGTATVTPCPNGWVRISISGTVNTTISFLRGEIWLGGYQNVAETIGTAFLWGGQLEAGAFPTSYVPTTTGALTRGADQASVNTLSPWYNQSAMTFYAEYAPIYTASATVPSNTPHVLQAYNTAVPNNNYGIRGVENVLNQVAVARNPTAGSQFPLVNLGTYGQAGVSRKVGYAINSSELQLAVNGSLGTTNSNNAAALMATHDKMDIGSGTGGSPPYQLNGWLRRITYYPRRLSNADLQTITA